MVLRQKGKCLICRRVPKKLVVDHCHDSGFIRGLICDNCNVGLGRFFDDPTTLRRAAKYVAREHKGRKIPTCA